MNRGRIYLTARVQRHHDRLVTVAHVSGVVTPVAAKRIMADLYAAARAAGSGAIVVVVEGSTWALCADTMEAAAMSLSDHAGIELPIAYVARQEDAQRFQTFAWRMAERGYLRGAFTCPARALSWARQKAAALGTRAPLGLLALAQAAEPLAQRFG